MYKSYIESLYLIILKYRDKSNISQKRKQHGMIYYKRKYILHVNSWANIVKNIMFKNINCERKNHHFSIKITKKLNHNLIYNIIITKYYNKYYVILIIMIK